MNDIPFKYTRTHARRVHAYDSPYLCARQQPSAINIYETLTFSVCIHFYALFSVEIYRCALYKKVRKPFSKCQVLMYATELLKDIASFEKEQHNKTKGLQQKTKVTLGTQSVNERALTHTGTLSALLFNDNTLIEWQLRQYKAEFVHLLFRLQSFLLSLLLSFSKRAQISNGKCTHTHRVHSFENDLSELHHIEMKCSGGSDSCMNSEQLCRTNCVFGGKMNMFFPRFCHSDFGPDIFFISNINFD